MNTQELWQSQAVDSPRVNPAYLRARAMDSVRIFRRRRLLESSSSVLALAAAALIWSWYSDLWMRAGAVWMVIACFIYAWQWWRMGASASVPEDLGALDTLHFHRRELERQHSMYKGLWLWALPLFVPIFGLLIYGRILLAPGSGMYFLTHKVPLVAAVLAAMVGITQYRAARLRREIELLDLLGR